MLQASLTLFPFYSTLLYQTPFTYLLILFIWYSCKRIDFAFIRKVLGLTQEGLAEKLEVDERTVRRWEAGKSQPTRNNLRAFSNLIDELKPVTEMTQRLANTLEELDKQINDLLRG
jgi:DNA-binding XRE family transcriptional regulator